VQPGHTSRQTTVTFPDASSEHVAPELVLHGSFGDMLAPMQAHVGLAPQEAGTGAHVYESGGTPPSGGAIPGGCFSQKNPVEHVVVPHGNGGA
jgi:hypothetical protein